MNKCKHELQNLCGTADGILCRRCGLVFKSFAELRADAGEPEEAAPAPAEEKATEKPKRGRKAKNQEQEGKT